MTGNRIEKIALALLSAVSLMPLAAQSGDRILIAYFTWAENTVVEDRARAVREANTHVFSMENNEGVDTVTTASVLPPGNTSRMASWIGEETGGELYSITVRDKYSCYWDECLDRASREKARKERPELTGPALNMDDYDVVFLGFPTWWYTVPMAVANFVESNDFSGKRVLPFLAHGTSGVARSIRDLEKSLPPSVQLEEEIGLYRSEIGLGKGRPDVENWLAGLGF